MSDTPHPPSRPGTAQPAVKPDRDRPDPDRPDRDGTAPFAPDDAGPTRSQKQPGQSLTDPQKEPRDAE